MVFDRLRRGLSWILGSINRDEGDQMSMSKSRAFSHLLVRAGGEGGSFMICVAKRWSV